MTGQQLQLVFEPQKTSTQIDLQALFHELNQRHWRGELPVFRCEWSERMITTWGTCYRTRRLIRISSFFRTRPAAELSALLSHEMIHIKYGGHGPRFKRELKRIGMEGDVQRLFPHLDDLTNALRRSYRYTYQCKECHLRIHRRRKIRGYCAECWERGIRSRFRLVARLSI